MGFFDKLFGKKDDANRAESLESTLGFAFPKRFKQLLQQLEGKKTDLILWDGPYEILPSLSLPIESVGDSYDQFEYLFNDMNSNAEGLKKIPFARSKEGDRFKYLYFIQAEGKQCEESVYLEDLDFPTAGSMKICEALDPLLGDIKQAEHTANLDVRDKSFSDLKDHFKLPETVSRFKDRHEGIHVRDQSENDTAKTNVQLHATFIKDSEDNSDCTNIHVDVTIVTDKQVIISYSTYMVDKNGLRSQFQNNFNYRIFYYKWCIFIEEMKYLSTQLKAQDIDIDAELDEHFSGLKLSKEMSNSFIQIDFMEV